MMSMGRLSEKKVTSVPDLRGEHYSEVLARLHTILRPKTYFEVGVHTGITLSLANCPSVAVDPSFAIADPAVFQKLLLNPAISFFRATSDDFFAGVDLHSIFRAPVDLAFLDGMHRSEFLLRDFANTERRCKRNSVIALHDCLPVEMGMADRSPHSLREQEHRSGWWSGDVWRTAILLKRRRPDLSFTVLDASPTGLVLITNLDPSNHSLFNDYQSCVADMLSWHIKDIGLPELFHELAVEPCSMVSLDEQITSRFWL